jgi:signal transduction histidine kinase
LRVFVLTAIAAFGFATRGEVLWPPIGPCIALYLLAASREDKSRSNVPLIAASVGLLVIYLGVVMAGSRSVATDLGHALLAGAVAWFAGERTRLRRQQLLDLHDRMRRSEDSAERELQLAVAQERTKIARDLHDSVGHALTLIAVRAGAARLRRDPAVAIDALTDIETIARDTTADIEQIVSPLRESGTDDRSPVGLASVNTLVARFRAAGHAVALTQGEEFTGLSASADQGAFRIIQEALTNAARHGNGLTTVTIEATASAVLVTVTNPVAERRASDRGRQGIVGMRERARLLGGVLIAEETEGEFRVELRLPRHGAQP